MKLKFWLAASVIAFVAGSAHAQDQAPTTAIAAGDDQTTEVVVVGEKIKHSPQKTQSSVVVS